MQTLTYILTVLRNSSSYLLCLILVISFPAYSQDDSAYLGSDSCQQCHQEQSNDWQASHHWHSMEEASLESVLGDFNNVEFDYFGLQSTFYQADGEYFVQTDNSEGELEDFAIKYTFGFYPLQQYLIEFPDGRLQPLSITWDSRSDEDGGQRWYHLYPDEEVGFDDPLHWTGSFQNWNSRCASCHSTNLEKNYLIASNTYETQFSEINVSCESCHGPGSEHVSWANGGDSISDKGLISDINKAWTPAGTGEDQIEALLQSIERSNPLHTSAQKEVCATCHSRRAELAHRDLNESFLDNNSLSTLVDGLYYPDGQIQDEVYVYGSFLQSKMHENQVTCTNCHDPHTQELLIEGNGLCLQCHSPAEFETETHFFHEQGSAAGQCINCHMPVTTYMGVDDRRDHSFRIPDPIATLELGVPNACTQCHLDKDAQWAAESFTALTGKTEIHYPHGRTLLRARNNDAFVQTNLIALAKNTETPAMVRATAIAELGRFPSQEGFEAIIESLAASDALIRAQAVSALDFVPVTTRLQVLQDMINDPVKSVRIEVARQLAGLPLDQLAPAFVRELNGLFDEFIDASLFNADLPGTMTELGLFYLAQNDLNNAEKAFYQGRRLSTNYLPALLNLADLYRLMEREADGEVILNEALVAFPESANVHHALGLLLVRTQRVGESLSSLKTAVDLDQTSARFALVYGVALESVGELDEAIRVLQAAVQRFPTDNQLYDLLTNYSSRR